VEVKLQYLDINSVQLIFAQAKFADFSEQVIHLTQKGAAQNEQTSPARIDKDRHYQGIA
jgi:hypothetical protein